MNMTAVLSELVNGTGTPDSLELYQHGSQDIVLKILVVLYWMLYIYKQLGCLAGQKYLE